jgi:effector-binding domain-containing protein
MPPPVIVEMPPTILASVTGRVARAELPRRVPEMLGEVWAFLKTAPVKAAGHNVCIYRRPDATGIELEAGVQVSGEFESQPRVVCSRTPSGRAAHVVHLGPYHQLGRAHDALIAYCDAQGFPVGAHWEVYGDWEEDPQKLRTDVYRAIGA